MLVSDVHWHATDKTGSAGKPAQGPDSSEMRLEDLSRQIAQLRKGKQTYVDLWGEQLRLS